MFILGPKIIVYDFKECLTLASKKAFFFKDFTILFHIV